MASRNVTFRQIALVLLLQKCWGEQENTISPMSFLLPIVLWHPALLSLWLPLWYPLHGTPERTCLTCDQSILPLRTTAVPRGGQAEQTVAHSIYCGQQKPVLTALVLSQIRSCRFQRNSHYYPTSNPVLPSLAAVCPIMSNSYTAWLLPILSILTKFPVKHTIRCLSEV